MDFDFEIPSRNDKGKYIIDDDYVKQVFKNLFSTNSDKRRRAMSFLLEGFCGFETDIMDKIDMSDLSPKYFRMLTFDGETEFSQEQIEKFHPEETLEQGKSFSNVKSLHKEGFDGRGTTIAILDTCFDSSIDEYKDENGESRVIKHVVIEKKNGEVKIRDYIKEDGNVTHGETTASLAAGKECGVAPKAKMYLFGIDVNSWKKDGELSETEKIAAWTEAKETMLRFMKHEIEEGRMKIPDIISISADYNTPEELINWFKERGCPILDSKGFWDDFTLGRLDENGETVLDGMVKTVYVDEIQYDKESGMGKRIEKTKERKVNATVMPFAGRTSVHMGKNGKPVYKYNGSFIGASYAIPQVGLLFALAKQISRKQNQSISYEEFVEVLKNPERINSEGMMYAEVRSIEDIKIKLDVLKSAVQATEEGTRTGAINGQAQTIKSIEQAKTQGQETQKSVGE